MHACPSRDCAPEVTKHNEQKGGSPYTAPALVDPGLSTWRGSLLEPSLSCVPGPVQGKVQVHTSHYVARTHIIHAHAIS